MHRAASRVDHAGQARIREAEVREPIELQGAGLRLLGNDGLEQATTVDQRLEEAGEDALDLRTIRSRAAVDEPRVERAEDLPHLPVLNQAEPVEVAGLGPVGREQSGQTGLGAVLDLWCVQNAGGLDEAARGARLIDGAAGIRLQRGVAQLREPDQRLRLAARIAGGSGVPGRGLRRDTGLEEGAGGHRADLIEERIARLGDEAEKVRIGVDAVELIGVLQQPAHVGEREQHLVLGGGIDAGVGHAHTVAVRRHGGDEEAVIRSQVRQGERDLILGHDVHDHALETVHRPEFVGHGARPSGAVEEL